jgi:hypothetical protein
MQFYVKVMDNCRDSQTRKYGVIPFASLIQMKLLFKLFIELNNNYLNVIFRDNYSLKKWKFEAIKR